MDRPWEAFDRARRVLRGRDDLVGWKSADLPSVVVVEAEGHEDEHHRGKLHEGGEQSQAFEAREVSDRCDEEEVR